MPKATGPDGRTAQVVGGGVLRCRLDGKGSRCFPPARATISSPISTTATTCSPTTTPTTGWDGGRGSRITSTAAITVIRLTITTGKTGYCRAWPSTAAARRAAACFTARTPGPRNTAACSSGPSGASVLCARFDSKRTGSTFKVAEKIDFVEHGKVDDFRPLDLALSYDGKTMYIADWSLGELGQQDREAGAGLRGDVRGKARETAARGKNSDPIEAQIRQLDHPSFNERFRAQTALIGKGKAALPAVTTALADASDRATWQTPSGLGGRRDRGGHARSELSSDRRFEITEPRRARPGGPRLGERAVPIAAEALVKRLKDGDLSVRLQAVIALGRIGHAQAIPAIVAAAGGVGHILWPTRPARRSARIGDWSAAAARTRFA